MLLLDGRSWPRDDGQGGGGGAFGSQQADGVVVTGALQGDSVDGQKHVSTPAATSAAKHTTIGLSNTEQLSPPVPFHGIQAYFSKSGKRTTGRFRSIQRPTPGSGVAIRMRPSGHRYK